MKSFALVEFYRGKAATVYSIVFKNEKENETDKFLSKFLKSHSDDLNDIVALIRRAADRRGMKNNYCRPSEGRITDCLIALPGKSVSDITGNTRDNPPELRLYALRLTDNTIVLYSGGVKPTGVRTYQEVPELDRIVKELQIIEGHILNRIKPPDRDIWYEGNDLKGDLKFDLD